MKFDDLLSRADDETLQNLLGSAVLRSLKLLDPTLTSPSRLREILLELHSPESLLLNEATRKQLLELLRPEQAKILALILDAPSNGDVFKALKEVKIRKNSERERALFDFFELPLPKPEIIDENPSSQISQPQYALFVHQRNAIHKVKQYLLQEPKRVLLHMPTGSGKTRTAMNVICDQLRSQEPTLIVWLAYSEELCEQAAEEFFKAWKFLGDRPINLYRFWGNHELDLTNVRDGIVVAGLSKLYSRAKRSIQFINQLGSRSSLVVIDEAHQAIAETYSLILDTLVIPYERTALLGLTATPGRTWSDINADAKLAQFFGQNKVTLEIEGYDSPVEYLIAEQYLAQPTFKSLLYQSGLELSDKDRAFIEKELELPKHILNRLADDEQRNLRILIETEELTYRHRRILVFAISVEHAKLLATVFKVKGLRANVITGTTPSLERDRLIEEFKNNSPEPQILCNYGVLTTGFDAPQTSAVVIARPTFSLVLYSQMVGRAIRGVKAGGNATAEIVTVVDSELPGFGSISEAFTNWEDVWRKD
jgi:superfamily II DNA or RNA helicase